MRSMWHHQKLPSKGVGAQYEGISPYFQIFVGQLPASLLLTLSTQIDRKDFEVLESYSICSCPGSAKAASHSLGCLHQAILGVTSFTPSILSAYQCLET